jgi:hypothetical protein
MKTLDNLREEPEDRGPKGKPIDEWEERAEQSSLLALAAQREGIGV